MKRSMILVLMSFGLWICQQEAGAQSPSIMPAGFEAVSLGMTSNQLIQARQNAKPTHPDLPAPDFLEIIKTNTFFEGVGYQFLPNGGLGAISFSVVNDEAKRKFLPGLLKGCIAKYGSNYEARVFSPSDTQQPSPKVALLRWIVGNARVVATFISDSNRQIHAATGGRPIVWDPYGLRIFSQEAMSTESLTNIFLGDIVESIPANQDTTGRAFTNFPAFLDSYTGPVWQ